MRAPKTRATAPNLSPSFTFGLMSLVILACCFVDVSHVGRLVAVGAICLACPAAARTPIGTLLRRLLPLASFAFFGLLVVLIAPIEPDTPALHLPLWERSVSAQAVAFMGALAVKSTLVVVVVTAFADLLSERDVMVGLRGLRAPDKVVDLTYMVLHSVSSARDEVMRLVRARDSRGRPRGLRGIAVAGVIARVLLVRLARRAETQAFALCSRGYAGRIEIAETRHASGPEVLLLAALAASLGWLALAA